MDYCRDRRWMYRRKRPGEEDHPKEFYDGDGGEIDLNGRLSVFGEPGRAYGHEKRIRLSEKDLAAAHTYILLNCPEVDKFLRVFEEELKAIQPGISAREIEKKTLAEFAPWLKNKDLGGGDVVILQNVSELAIGPTLDQRSYNGFKVNGWEFHTKAYEQGKSTTDTGVCVVGDCAEELGLAYYAELEDIVQITYKGKYGGSINLFKCRWFDNTLNKGIKVDRFGIIDIDLHRSAYTSKPFVLPSQASQVYYTRSPSKKRPRPPAQWHAVIHTPARHRVHLVNVDDEVFQDDQPFQSSAIEGVDDKGFDLVEHGVKPIEVDTVALLQPDGVELLVDPESENEDVGDEDGYESPLDEDSGEDIF